MDTINLSMLNSDFNIIQSPDSLQRFASKLLALKKGKSNIQIMHYGDSHISMGHFTSRFESNLREEYTSSKFKRWLHFSFKNPIRYHNRGVGGSQYLKMLEKKPNVLSSISTIQPDLLVLSFGTNESYSPNFDPETNKVEIKNFIDSVKLVSPKTEILLTTSPDTNYEGKNPKHADAINMIIRNIAAETKSSIWDLNMIMGKNTMPVWIDQKLGSEDRLHFTPEGYQLQADTLFLALKKLIPSK